MLTIALRKCTEQIEKHTKSLQIVGGDFNAEMAQECGVERVSDGPHTLKEGNRRGDWLKQWMMIHVFTAVNATYSKRLTAHLEGTANQIDYTLIKRRHLKYSEDA